MKSRTSIVGQYIYENVEDAPEDKDYISKLTPLIGEVVIIFNSLEGELDQFLCQFFSDRSDHLGLTVLQDMMYSSKVDLYNRFTKDLLRESGWDIPIHKELISQLKTCGTLRNRIVHANWKYVDTEGYTQVRIRSSNDRGLEHEFYQFTVESMNEVVNRIYTARDLLFKFDEQCQEERFKERREYRNAAKRDDV